MDARVEFGRCHADIGGRRSKPALGLAHVGTAPDQCPPVTDRYERGEMRRHDTCFESPRCPDGSATEQRRQFEDFRLALALERRDRRANRGNQRLRPGYLEPGSGPGLELLFRDVGFLLHDVKRLMRDGELLCQSTYRGVGARSVGRDDDPHVVTSCTDGLCIGARGFDGATHAPE
jgi:hypothetical protein